MIQTAELKIFGMSCAGCASGIERNMKESPGIQSIQVDFGTKLSTIRFEDSKTSFEKVLSHIEELGYEVFPADDESANPDAPNYDQKIWVGFLLFAPLFVLGMFFKTIPYSGYMQAFLATLAFAYLAKPYFVSALHGVKSKILGMDVLVSLGAGSAFFYSWLGLFGYAPAIYFDGAIAILYFLTIGKFLEEKSKSSAFASLEDLLLMDQKEVRLIVEGAIKTTPLKELTIGSQILVPAGEVIPIDGLVREGNSSVDESLLTGEAEPVYKDVDSQVYSGSKNLEQSLTIEVTHLAKESTMARIANQVKAARMQKANLARIADKIAGVFVPIVIFLAFATAIYWYFNGGVSVAVLNAVSVLLIACPCALGLATPAAISVGLNTALKKGVLIRNVKVIENISQVTHLVLDKTGTLTAGCPELRSIRLTGDLKEEEVLAIAYSLERNAAHPFAESIIKICNQRNISPLEGLEVEGLVGKGLKGQSGENVYYLGSPGYLEQQGISIDLEDSFMGFSLAKNNKLMAHFDFVDPIRPGIEDFTNFIEKSELTTVLLSGDRQAKVDELKKSFQFNQAIGEVSPQGKADFVQQLRDKDSYVAMIGDGMNDSSALANANLGVSFQQGSDLAKSSADIVLMKDDLGLIADSFRISYAIRSKILQNYFWAFLYNVISIPLAMAGLLNPMIAAAAMALSSTSVVMNSLLLKRI